MLVLEFAQSVAPGVSGSRLNMLNLINAQALLPPLMKLILLGAAPAQTLEPERVRRNVRLIVSPCVRSSPVTLRDARAETLARASVYVSRRVTGRCGTKQQNK